MRDFAELTPFYGQVVGLFSAIFLFIALIMGVIVLFAVVNTMTMNVMERTNEIGTIRAMGVRRNGVRAQFVVEGWLLGAIAATVGVVLAFARGRCDQPCRTDLDAAGQRHMPCRSGWRCPRTGRHC